jgi:hypothetical protein
MWLGKYSLKQMVIKPDPVALTVPAAVPRG